MPYTVEALVPVKHGQFYLHWVQHREKISNAVAWRVLDTLGEEVKIFIHPDHAVELAEQRNKAIEERSKKLRYEEDRIETVVKRFKTHLQACAHSRVPFDANAWFVSLCDNSKLTDDEIKEAKQRISIRMIHGGL